MDENLARIKKWASEHEQEMAEELSRWIRIPSVRDDSTAGEGKPFGEKCAEMLDYAYRKAKEWGFYVQNHEGYCLTVCDGAPKPDDFGILAHMDVVAAGDDWSFPPFSGEIRDDFILGRGATDNKSACVMGLFLLRAMRELNISFKRNIRLVLGANEENSMPDMEYYVSHYAPPALSLVPDAAFPVNFAQKGIARGKYSLPVDDDIVYFDAGLSINAVPAKATAIISADIELPEELPEGITVCPDGQGMRLEASGISSHAANPAAGKSAICMMTGLLQKLDLKPNSRRAMELMHGISADYTGAALGIACSDEHTHATTIIMGTAHGENNSISFSTDSRVCLAMTSEQAAKKITDYCEKNGIRVDNMKYTPSVFFSPDSPVIRTLQDSWRELTGHDDKVYSSGGNTYSRAVPNSITYGIMQWARDIRPAWLLPGRGAAHAKDELIHASVQTNALVAYYYAFACLDEKNVSL